MKFKAKRWKEITKIRAEINEIETNENISMKSRAYLEKNQQSRLKKRENTQIIKITNEREDLTPQIT